MTLPIVLNFPGWLTTAKESVLMGLAHLKHLWSVWSVATFILVSLGLQIILIFLGPFRKKTSNFMVVVSVWLAYLLADYVAIQAVGLIPNFTTKSSTKSHPDILAFWAPFLLVHLGGPDPITALALEDNELWTRTALHLVTYTSATARVFFQSLPSNIIAIPTLLMLGAGILKFLERTMSLYNARLTQFKSSMLKEPDPGPNYAKLMESYDSYLKSALPARFDTNPEPDQYNTFTTVDHSKMNDDSDADEEKQPAKPSKEEKSSDTTNQMSTWNRLKWLCFCLSPPEKDKLRNVELVRKAFEFYEKYKGLYVDLIFTFHDRNESRTYFLDKDLQIEEAFRVLEMELNFTYEVFFTKMIVIHQTSGRVIRFISTTLEVASLLIWILFIDKAPFQTSDIVITYILLVGAIIIDWIAFFMVIVSDWQLAMLNKESQRRAFLYDKLLSGRRRTWGGYWGSKGTPCVPWIRRVLFRRWSESVSQFSLIRYCVDRWSTFPKIFFAVVPPLKDKFDGIKYVSKEWFADELRDFIYNELKYKAEIAEDPKDAEEICDSKGDWVLRSLSGLEFEPFTFFKWTTDVEYDECLLLWHIATELLYQDEEPITIKEFEDKPKADNSANNSEDKRNQTKETEAEEKAEPEVATEESMAKLDQPAISVSHHWWSFLRTLSIFSCFSSNPQSAPADKVPPPPPDYRKISKTLSEYMMYLLTRQPVMMFAVAGISEVRYRDTMAEANIFFDRVLPKAKKGETKAQRLKKACARVMDVNTTTPPKDIKGDRSKSVLFDAVQLAKELKKVKENKETGAVGMWELMAKVWVELLSYSASHTRASAHAAQLRHGGELLTLIWLMMVHFGLGKQFRITQGNARSKLIITK